MRRLSAVVIISAMAPWLAYLLGAAFVVREVANHTLRRRSEYRPSRAQMHDFYAELDRIKRSL